MLEAASESEQERDGVGGEMLVIAAAHVGHHDLALDQRVIKPRAAQPGAGRANPAQLHGAGEQFGRYGAIGSVGVGDVVTSVLRIAERLDEDAGHRVSNFLWP